MNARIIIAVASLFAIAVMACLFAACGSGGFKVEPPTGSDVPESIRKSLAQTIALVERAINDEDTILAANQVANIFKMDGLVAFRLRRSNAPALPVPADNIAVLLNDFYRDNENIRVTLRLRDVTQNGDLASSLLEFHLSATYALESPPINYFVDSVDRVTFQREGGAWKLINWEEVEEVSSGDEQNPGNLEPIVAINRAVTNVVQMINTGDFRQMGGTVSSLFSVDPIVGKRFKTHATESGGNPAPGFDRYFQDVNLENENLVFSLNVLDWEITEDLASVTAEFNLAATYVLTAPPTVYYVQAVDVLNFRRENDGFWRVISWVESAEEIPGEEAENTCRLLVLTLQDTIRSKDLNLIGESFAPGFFLPAEIGMRFKTHVTESGQTPPGDFSSHMQAFFAENVNVNAQLVLSNFAQNGDVATGSIAFNLNSTFILSVPPQDYTVTETGDTMQFLKGEDGKWRILYWLPEEASAPGDAELVAAQIEKLGQLITARNAGGAAELFSPLFALPANVAYIFKTDNSEENPPSGDFEEHISKFLQQNANVSVAINPVASSVSVSGELAQLEADVHVVSDYLLETPPARFDETTRTVFSLVKTDGSWLVYRWELKT